MNNPGHLSTGSLPRNKREVSRAAVCLSIVSDILSAVKKGRSADSVLSALFRTDHRFGSRDRRFIADTAFSFFRSCNVLGKVISPAALLAARTADGLPVDSVDVYWGETLDVSESDLQNARSKQTALERLRVIMPLLKMQNIPESALDFVPERLHAGFSRAALDKAYCDWMMKRPVLWLRSNHGKPFSLPEKYQCSSPAGHPGSLRVMNPDGALSQLPEFVDGEWEIQDFSSQCIGLAASPAAGECWLDVCAGAGGKTLQMSSMMNGIGKITSCDIYPSKLQELKRRADRAGFRNIETVCRDSTETFPASFDGVLVDVPCSSSGRWRRNPESRLSLTMEKLDSIVGLQKNILEAAANAVRPGGVLVYATCSVFYRENRGQIEAFLKDHPEFYAESFPHPLEHETLTDGMLEIMPCDCDCDASFAARLRKAPAALDKKE